MCSVLVGAAVVNKAEQQQHDDEEIMYLRAKFYRVRGSSS